MVEMLSFVSKNCGKIDGIHPSHDPCNYNFKIRLPKVEIKSAYVGSKNYCNLTFNLFSRHLVFYRLENENLKFLKLLENERLF